MNVTEAHDEKGHVVCRAVEKSSGTLFYGQKLIWGNTEESALPIVNLPPDAVRVRRRFRNNSFAHAFVKTATGVRHFYLTRCKGRLELTLEQGRNQTDPS